VIHTIHTMTIRQYGELDRTGDMSLLKRWFNPLPVKWFDTERFFNEFKDSFGNTTDDKQDEAYRIISYNRIIILDRILRTMAVLMQDHNDRQLFSLMLKQEFKNGDKLKFYIDKVKQLTGIEIKDGDDLNKLQKETQRLLDKYNERYKAEEPKEKQPFIDIALGVFSIMEMSYNESMVLSEFARLKDLADKKIKQIQNARDKRNN